jgi:histidinol phosphatase-like enzyme
MNSNGLNIQGIDNIILDVDGTLVKKWTSEFIPGVEARLAELKMHGKRLFIATNQGGPAYNTWYELQGKYSEKTATIYPTLLTTLLRLDAIMQRITAERCYIALNPGVPAITKELYQGSETDITKIITIRDDQIKISYDPSWRKPQGSMLLALMQDADLDQANSIYVGDQQIDFDAAHNAGIWWYDSKYFFEEMDITR